MAVAAFDPLGDTRRTGQQVVSRFFRSYKMFRHKDLKERNLNLVS
jgi:hypothetical protein